MGWWVVTPPNWKRALAKVGRLREVWIGINRGVPRTSILRIFGYALVVDRPRERLTVGRAEPRRVGKAGGAARARVHVCNMTKAGPERRSERSSTRRHVVHDDQERVTDEKQHSQVGTS